jgi:uncharacterized radical SAM superfamily Fe-S cluster-containing enzyme
MAATNYGVCDRCYERVPVTHVARDGKVYLRKDCPGCGAREHLISSDAARWQEKRDICRYDPESVGECNLQCVQCTLNHRPRIVFVDVTNRCNLNCPICLANVPSMGFVFEPPLSYFERMFSELGTWEPKPRLELFGGEPTVRKDFFEIIRLARDHGLPVSLVTNSVALADEEYCKKVCDESIDMLLAFDGRDEETYVRMRGSAAAYQKKLDALDNVLKHSKRKHTVVCTVARNLNDRVMEDYFEFIHGYRSIIRRLFFIPLAEMWEGDEYEARVMTTPEDCEQILKEAFPNDELEFLPAGLLGFIQPAYSFFSESQIRFAGVHPNCESSMFLVSDGERYRPISSILRKPLSEFAAEVVDRAVELNPRLAKLDKAKRFQRMRGQLMALRAYLGPMRRALDLKRITKGHPFLTLLKVMGGLMLGRKMDDLVAKYTTVESTVPVTILPFEERHSVESARLERCSAGFAYIDPETDELKTVPFCIWTFYREDTFRKIAEKQAAEAEAAAV